MDNYMIKDKGRFERDRKYIEANPESLVGKQFYFEVLEETEEYVEIAKDIFVMGENFHPYFVATVKRTQYTNYYFLWVDEIQRFPYSRSGQLKHGMTEEEVKQLRSVKIEFKKEDPKNIKALRDASELGYLSVIEYLFEHDRNLAERKRNWVDMVAAAENGHLQVVKYFADHKVPGVKESLVAASKRGHLNVVMFLIQETDEIPKLALLEAISNGHLHIVKLLHSYTTSPKLLERAVITEQKEIVEYLVDSKFPIGKKEIDLAITAGSFEIFKILFYNDAPVDEDTLTDAVRAGYFSIVKFLIDNGVPASENAMLMAAYNVNFPIIELLIDDKAPMKENEILGAVIGGGQGKERDVVFEIVKYLIKNGAEVSENDVELAQELEYPEISEYLRKKWIEETGLLLSEIA
uniref:Ankyrin repeat protein n=1 Tax=Pithovirus LCDPAC01 TaxID=2506600 RepID=A0A481YMP1_9VIRU|nr:MAG: ankyrin repeat protein [Pithovirus LCDPAC01]